MSQIEIYARETKETKTERDELTLQELGLELLSKEDLETWKAFLPTAYPEEYIQTRCEHGHPVTVRLSSTLDRYRYDEIPTQVQATIALLRDVARADRIEIRTPEGRGRDPILLAEKKGEGIALAARWGAEEFFSVEEIREGLWAQARAWKLTRNKGGLCLIFLLWIGLIATPCFLVYATSEGWVTTPAFFAARFDNPDAATLASFFSAWVAGMIGFWTIGWYLGKRLWGKELSCVRAIAARIFGDVRFR